MEETLIIIADEEQMELKTRYKKLSVGLPYPRNTS